MGEVVVDDSSCDPLVVTDLVSSPPPTPANLGSAAKQAIGWLHVAGEKRERV